MAEVKDKVLFQDSIAPSISKEKRESIEPKEEKVEPIVKTKVSKRKKSPVSKLAETFIKEDLANVGSFLLFDVLVPAIRDTVVNMITEGVNRVAYGDDARPSYRGSYSGYGSNNRTNYSSRSSSYSGNINTRHASKARTKVMDDVLFDFRDEAVEVKSTMESHIYQYGEVSLEKFKRWIGEEDTIVYTDRNFGWTDPDAFSIRKIREGYLLILPPLEDLR